MKLLIPFLILLAGCKSTFKQNGVEVSCELVSFENEIVVDSSSFFQTYYKAFLKSEEPGIIWYSRETGDTRIVIVKVNGENIDGRIIGENGYQQSISLSSKEENIFKTLLADVQKRNIVQDCNKPISTHLTATNIYIKDRSMNSFSYYTIHSPFSLSETSKKDLGNAYKLMEITYFKAYNPNRNYTGKR